MGVLPFRAIRNLADIVNAVSYPGSAGAATIIARRGTGPSNDVEALLARRDERSGSQPGATTAH